MRPYYEKDGISIFKGDSLEILPQLGPQCADVVLTDPPWPGCDQVFPGSDRPYELFAEAAAHFPSVCSRVMIWLGCNSDPRFLSGVPATLPFFTTIRLRRVPPS